MKLSDAKKYAEKIRNPEKGIHAEAIELNMCWANGTKFEATLRVKTRSKDFTVDSKKGAVFLLKKVTEEMLD